MEQFREMLATLVFVEHEMERQLLKVEWVLHKMEWKSWLKILNILLNPIDWILDDNHHSIYLQQNFHILQNINYKLVFDFNWSALVWVEFTFVWSCLVCFGLVWSGLLWFWSGLVWFVQVWSDWLGWVWFGPVWFGWVWFLQVWFALVWFHLEWFGQVGFD